MNIYFQTFECKLRYMTHSIAQEHTMRYQYLHKMSCIWCILRFLFLGAWGVSSNWNISRYFASFSDVQLGVAWSPALLDTVAIMRILSPQPSATRNTGRYSTLMTHPHAPRKKNLNIIYKGTSLWYYIVRCFFKISVWSFRRTHVLRRFWLQPDQLLRERQMRKPLPHQSPRVWVEHRVHRQSSFSWLQMSGRLHWQPIQGVLPPRGYVWMLLSKKQIHVATITCFLILFLMVIQYFKSEI